ncbi:MAG: hypothetical protein R3Y50_08930 [Rikenellaceae bacterium]
MKRFFTILLSTLFFSAATASTVDSLYLNNEEIEEKAEKKLTYKFGGTLDLRFIYDSYAHASVRNSAIYFMPLAPSYDTNGVDLNDVDKLTFNPYATRLTFSVDGIEALGAKGRLYIETDFAGSGDSYMQMLRMRHAYLNLDWEKNSLLLGQTNNLNFPSEIISNTVDMAGIPYCPLNRGMQIRYSHKFGKNVIFRSALEMFTPHNSVGPTDAQSNALMPAISAQMVFGNSDRFLAGLTAEFKVLKPYNSRTNSMGEVFAVNEKISSGSISAFAKYTVNDYKFQLWGIYGSNLSHLSMIGGYGKVAGSSIDTDYEYANIYTMTSWFDFETPKFSNFQFGLFTGYQHNFGSKEALDLTQTVDGTYDYGYFRYGDVNWHGRVAVRSFYHATSALSFGLEYGYNYAQWSKEVDEYLQPIETYPVTVDNRLILYVRFVF